MYSDTSANEDNRSGITFVSRNMISHYVIRRLTSHYLEHKQPSRVGGSPLRDVVSSFLCHTHTDRKAPGMAQLFMFAALC